MWTLVVTFVVATAGLMGAGWAENHNKDGCDFTIPREDRVAGYMYECIDGEVHVKRMR